MGCILKFFTLSKSTAAYLGRIGALECRAQECKYPQGRALSIGMAVASTRHYGRAPLKVFHAECAPVDSQPRGIYAKVAILPAEPWPSDEEETAAIIGRTGIVMGSRGPEPRKAPYLRQG